VVGSASPARCDAKRACDHEPGRESELGLALAGRLAAALVRRGMRADGRRTRDWFFACKVLRRTWLYSTTYKDGRDEGVGLVPSQ